MAKPARNSIPSAILSNSRTFFVTSKTVSGRALLQTQRNAMLLIDVMRSYTATAEFKIHDFVIMPDHVHFLITVSGVKEYGYARDIWQRGFSEVRVDDRKSFLAHRVYIEQNPVKAGFVERAEDFPYSSIFLRRQKAAAAKAG